MAFKRPTDPKDPDNIKVECTWCGEGSYWIPTPILEELDKLRFINNFLYEALGPANDEIYDMAVDGWNETL